MIEFERKQFKDKVLIFCVLHYNFECVCVTIKNILLILDKMPDVFLVLIDSRSDLKVKKFFDNINHPQVDKVSLPINFGYNTSVNFYIRDFIHNMNLPRIIIRLDADILFSYTSFNYLIEAIDQLALFSTIGMTYEDNDCNPQINTFFKAKKHIGKNQKIYFIKHPFLTPVAGGIMGFRGEILKNELNYQLFQPKYLPKKFNKILPVGGADSALYNALKGKYKMGYLEGTKAYHLKSRDNTVLNIPDDYRHLLEH